MLKRSLVVGNGGICALLDDAQLRSRPRFLICVGQRASCKTAGVLNAHEKLIQTVKQRGVTDGRGKHLIMVIAEVNAAEQALVQLWHFLPPVPVYLRAQHGRIHVDSQLTALVFPQNAGILHVRLPDDVDGFIEHRHAHRRVNVNVVRVGGFEPAEHLPFRVRQQGFRLCFRPLRHVGQRDFNTDGLPVIGAKSPLRDGNTLVRHRVPLKAGVRRFAVLIGIAENHVFQVAVIVESDRI